MNPGGACRLTLTHRTANRAQKLTKVGVDTPAHIDAMESTGNTDTPGGTEYDPDDPNVMMIFGRG